MYTIHIRIHIKNKMFHSARALMRLRIHARPDFPSGLLFSLSTFLVFLSFVLPYFTLFYCIIYHRRNSWWPFLREFFAFRYAGIGNLVRGAVACKCKTLPENLFRINPFAVPLFSWYLKLHKHAARPVRISPLSSLYNMARPILRLRGTDSSYSHSPRVLCSFNHTRLIVFCSSTIRPLRPQNVLAYALLARLFTTVLELKSKHVSALQSRPISLVPLTDRRWHKKI